LNLIPYLPAVGAGLVAGLLILVEARSVRLALLAIQYLAVALLSALALPLNVAMVKWVAGLMSCGILALTFSRLADTREAPIQEVVPAGRWFRLLAILLVVSAALGLARTDWLGVPEIQPAANLGASLLMGLGLLQIGLQATREHQQVRSGHQHGQGHHGLAIERLHAFSGERRRRGAQRCGWSRPAGAIPVLRNRGQRVCLGQRRFQLCNPQSELLGLLAQLLQFAVLG